MDYIVFKYLGIQNFCLSLPSSAWKHRLLTSLISEQDADSNEHISHIFHDLIRPQKQHT